MSPEGLEVSDNDSTKDVNESTIKQLKPGNYSGFQSENKSMEQITMFGQKPHHGRGSNSIGNYH
jgi:hypothetical protein